MPLKVIVIGAGVAGLSAAVALRQAGHKVTIYEKSAFATEVGAALGIAPNGAKVLNSLGFSWERARAVRFDVWEGVDGISLAQLSSVDLKQAERDYGQPMRGVHRVDLHTELLRLALQKEEEDDVANPPVDLKLASPVAHIDPVEGSLRLEDGREDRADLVIAADGLHSVARKFVVGENVKAVRTDLASFRMLIPSEKMLADPSLADLVKWKKNGAAIIVDSSDMANERHAVWYPCQNGEQQNIVGIHPARNDVTSETDIRALLLEEFSNFHPDLLKLFGLAEHVKLWSLTHFDPFPSWINGRLVLIGDAGHPMMPFGGQAANLAFEDAGALGVLMRGVETAELARRRLEIYQELRRDRVSTIQILSSTRINNELDVQHRLLAFKTPENSAPTSFKERVDHAFKYDVIQEAEKCLTKH